MEFKPLNYKEKLEIINPEGNSGIVTLWSKPEIIKEKLKSLYPKLFETDSPLVTISSLYGNGLPQMLANLAFNPQIQKIAIVGQDREIARSSSYLLNFLEKGITLEKIAGVEMAKVNGTNFYMDSQLNPKDFSHLQVKRFGKNEYSKMIEFLSQESQTVSKKDRLEIKLKKPEFTDFPSHLSSHQIIAETPIEAWLDLLYHLDRFGKNVIVPKRSGPETKRSLLNFKAIIKNPGFESEDRLREIGIDPEELRKYQKQILNLNIPKDSNYGYGNRMRKYFGGDCLEKIASMLKKDSGHRHCLVSLWDSKRDLLERKSSPCFTDGYFIKNFDTGEMDFLVNFRTHNAIAGWFANLYGLRAVQEFVANRAELKPGEITVNSRWLSIDPENAKTMAALGAVKKYRKISLDIKDPKGYYNVTPDFSSGKIIVEHFSPQGVLLENFEGKSALGLKSKLRQISGFSSSDHAMWVGMELMKAEMKLKKK